MMKKALAAAALAAMAMSAQANVVINEGFDNVKDLAGKGWVTVDNSTPGGTTPGWFQGGIFDKAQSGASSSYIAANWTGAPDGGSIDNWLYTPVFDASHGATVTFYLRADFFDGTSDQVNFGFVNADGTFTSTALTAVNPVPTDGWTAYTASVDWGGPSAARFAFEYVGSYATSNYVGLDSVNVDLPEPASLALVAGGLLGLGAMRRRTRR